MAKKPTSPRSTLNELIRVSFSGSEQSAKSPCPVAQFQSAGKIASLIVSAVLADPHSRTDIVPQWQEDGYLLLFGTPRVDQLLDDVGGIDQVLSRQVENLSLLQHFISQPSGQFRHAAWLQALPVSALDRLAVAYRLANALDHSSGVLLVNGQSHQFPAVDLPTTRLLHEERTGVGRLVSFNLDCQIGQVELIVAKRGNPTVAFRCPDESIFSKIPLSRQRFQFQYRPTIDLLSREQGQLHQVEILDIQTSPSAEQAAFAEMQ